MPKYTLEQVVEVFDMLPEWDDRYGFLTEMGEQMETLPQQHMLEENLVPGCMSKVWVIGEPAQDGSDKLHLIADCDTPVVKGLVALLVIAYDDKTAQEILDTDMDAMFETLGLDENISPRRHVGMYSMVDTIKKIAIRHL